MPRLILIFAALLVMATPASAGLFFLNSPDFNARGTASGFSGALVLSPTHLGLSSYEIGSTDPTAPILFPNIARLGLPLEFFDGTLHDGSYHTNNVLLSSYLPDPRGSWDGGTIPFTVPRFDLTNGSADITFLSNPVGLITFRYTASARGSDYLTGNEVTITISGTAEERADFTWGDSSTMLFKNAVEGISIVLRTTGSNLNIVPVPEPPSALILTTGAVCLAASRRLRRGKIQPT